MSLIDQVIIGQTFRAACGPCGNVYSWRIDSPVMWSEIGTRFVWCVCQRAGKRKWRPRPFELDQITGDIGKDLRWFFETNPHLPVGRPA